DQHRIRQPRPTAPHRPRRLPLCERTSGLKQDSMNPTPKPVTVIPTQRQMSLIRFSPNGQFLFAAGRDGKIHRWDLHSTDGPPADALSPSKRGDPPATLTYPEMAPLSGHDGWVTQVAVHPQGTQLFSADSWGRLIGWSLANGDPQPAWNLPSAHDG